MQVPVVIRVKAVPDTEHIDVVRETNAGVSPLEDVIKVVITTPASPTLRVADPKVEVSVWEA